MIPKVNDNKTVRDESTKDLLNILLQMDINTLTPLYKTMLGEVLINGKTFGELKEIVKLPTSRQKVVFKNAVNTLINALKGVNDKLAAYDLLQAELILAKRSIKNLEDKISKENAIPPKLKKKLAVPIGKSGLSSRAQQVCSLGNVHSVYDLVSLSRREFLSLRNCGKISADEVETYLYKNGLSWKMFNED